MVHKIEHDPYCVLLAQHEALAEKSSELTRLAAEAQKGEGLILREKLYACSNAIQEGSTSLFLLKREGFKVAW